MKYPETSVRYTITLLLTIFLMIPSMASAFDDTTPKSHNAGKAFFDIDTGKLNQQSLSFVLGGISVTYDELEALGLTPDFLVSFRGMNTGVISTKQSSEDVQTKIAFLNEKGVKIEVCSKAIHLSGEDPAFVLPEIKVIGNYWISSMLRQNQNSGYAYIVF